MRSFAEKMLHLTDAIYGLASGATGIASPIGQGESEKTTDISKSNVTKLVMAGYDFVIANIQKMNDQTINVYRKIFGIFEINRVKAIEKAFEHQNAPERSNNSICPFSRSNSTSGEIVLITTKDCHEFKLIKLIHGILSSIL